MRNLKPNLVITKEAKFFLTTIPMNNAWKTRTTKRKSHSVPLPRDPRLRPAISVLILKSKSTMRVISSSLARLTMGPISKTVKMAKTSHRLLII